MSPSTLPSSVQPNTPASRLAIWAMVIVAIAVGAAWLLNTPPGLMGKADAIGYAICHRISVRSFFVGEVQMPLCARCSGMYLGVLVGLAVMAALGAGRARPIAAPLAARGARYFRGGDGH